MVLIFYVWVGAARLRDRTNEIDEERRSREIGEFREALHLIGLMGALRLIGSMRL